MDVKEHLNSVEVAATHTPATEMRPMATLSALASRLLGTYDSKKQSVNMHAAQEATTMSTAPIAPPYKLHSHTMHSKLCDGQSTDAKVVA
jgi:hypothetical protein